MSKRVSPAKRLRADIDEAPAAGAGRIQRRLFVVALIGEGAWA